jgi:hypothetical protein
MNCLALSRSISCSTVNVKSMPIALLAEAVYEDERGAY